MTSFWLSGTGMQITGKPEDAFISDFSIIPDGTVATAMLKKIVTVTKDNQYTATTEKYYEATWKILDGEFKNREVTQKIKCFNGKPEQIDRNLNMLKLLMILCEFKPTHSNAPDDLDMMPMIGKQVVIKIREWSMPKNDGGIIEGNFVSELHKIGDIEPMVGVKKEVISKPTRGVESALTRNPKMIDLNDDLPF
jgi:hypothetical protein